jgi:SAM-dependent methyltransferase
MPPENMSHWLAMGDYEQRRYGLVAGFFTEFHGRLLDVGCHKAGLRKYLGPGVEYVGVDNMAEGCPGVIATDLNEGKLPFDDGTFGAVVCTATLEHLFRPLELLQEMARVLNDAGRILISVPNDRGLSAIVSAMFFRIPPYEAQVYGHHWRFSRETARRFVSRAFEIEREAPHFGPLYDRYLFFLKWSALCTEWFMFGHKKPAQ